MDLNSLAAFRYELPEHLVAQEPGERGASRLLVISKQDGQVSHHRFADLPSLLPAGALLVANNSRVLPVRLLAQTPTGGKAECFILTPVPLLEQAALADSAVIEQTHNPMLTADADVLLKPGKFMQPGREIAFGGLLVRVLEKGEFGHHKVRLTWQGSLCALLNEAGHMPLPPYIRRPDTEADQCRYQTIYARADKAGSAAAPTAGLHFTDPMRASLVQHGFEWAEVTLHVGYGTFSPVRHENLDEHVMHAEYVECSEATAEAILRAKAQGRAVIAVGTTSCRTLEGIAATCGKIQPYSGWINLFIRPGFAFKSVDGLITNFHLPESTLLMLVSALAGYKSTMSAYAEAVREEYRFFSYGDASLIV